MIVIHGMNAVPPFVGGNVPMTRREQPGQPRCGLWDELIDTPDTGWQDLL